MTQRILLEVARLLYLIIKSDKFVRAFTKTEQESIIRAHEAITSVSRYPDNTNAW